LNSQAVPALGERRYSKLTHYHLTDANRGIQSRGKRDFHLPRACHFFSTLPVSSAHYLYHFQWLRRIQEDTRLTPCMLHFATLGSSSVRVRKPLSALTKNEVNGISDEGVKALVLARLNGGDPKAGNGCR
jgi:hypothetical protein